MSDLKVIEPNKVYTYAEFKNLLGIGRDFASKLVKEKQIVPKKVGQGQYLFMGSTILEYLNRKDPGNNR